MYVLVGSCIHYSGFIANLLWYNDWHNLLKHRIFLFICLCLFSLVHYWLLLSYIEGDKVAFIFSIGRICLISNVCQYLCCRKSPMSSCCLLVWAWITVHCLKHSFKSSGCKIIFLTWFILFRFIWVKHDHRCLFTLCFWETINIFDLSYSFFTLFSPSFVPL